jgi:hypothetical protein
MKFEKWRTWIGAELDYAGEWTVSFIVSSLDFDEVGGIWCQAFNRRGHLIPDDTFHHPVPIALRAVCCVEDDVTYRKKKLIKLEHKDFN